MHKVHSVPEDRTVEANDGERFQDLADRENLGIPFGCKNGICGTCIVKIKTGMEHISPKQSKEKNTLEMFEASEEHRLACQCNIYGNIQYDEP